MQYYISKIVSDTTFEAVITKITELLKEQGFGIITEIDVTDTFKKKLDIDYKKYRILGACNPAFAHKALQLEDKIGTMLPCNVIVQQLEQGKIEVAAVDPAASMMAVNNEQLTEIATEVRKRLEKVIANL